MTRILIVDDMAVFREPIAIALRANGFETVCAENGRQALGLVKSRAPDLILLDVAMPVMNGIDYLKAVRDDPTIPRPPVILLTAVAEKDYVVQAAQLGVKEYMLKSAFSLDDLLGRIGRCLEEAAAQRAPEKSAGGMAGRPRTAVTARAKTQELQPQPMMERGEVLNRLMASEHLVAFSPAVSQVLEATAGEGASIDTIAAAIKQDHAMAIKILKLANSAIYKRGRPVDSIDKAVMRIGSAGIRQAVLNLGVMERFSDLKLGEIDGSQFWEHSIACGIISAEIAAARGAEQEQAFTAGLLHDVGRIVCARQLGRVYDSVIRAARESGLPLEHAEQRMLGIEHADAMGHLLQKWNFPRDLIDPIVLHHLPAAAIRVAAPGRVHAVATLALADRLSHAMCLGSSGNETLYPTEELCELLGADSVLVARIVATARKQTEEMKLAMLASSGQEWVDRRQRLRGMLDRSVRPLFIGRNVERDAFRIFCQQLSDQRAEPPNVGVVHVGTARDRAALSQRYEFAESQASPARLPLVVIAPREDLVLEGKAMAGRHSEVLVLPVPIPRLLEALNRAVGAGTSSAAA